MNANSTRRLMITGLALVMAAPAAVFFVSAIGRSLQPTVHQPARTLEAIVAWFGALPGVVSVAVLVVLPFIGLVLAACLLWNTWTTEEGTRADALALAQAATRIVRRFPFLLAALVVVFGVLYFAAVVVHAIAG